MFNLLDMPVHQGYTTTGAKITAIMLSSVTKVAFQTVISMVLGFMLVWDLPSIKQGVSTLGRCVRKKA